MATTRISGWVAVAGLVLAGCGASRVPPEAETCLGGGEAAAKDYVALGMPSNEPDLQAWVTLEQHGLTRVTTEPCEPQPSTRMLMILPEAPVVQLDGERRDFSTIRPGQKISVWYAGGAKGKARAVVIERAERWPPGSATPTPPPEPAPNVEPSPAASPAASPG